MYTYKIKEILRVVDGDTVDVLIDLGFGVFKKERVRLGGIDAPESRTKDLYEKKLGLEAKAELERYFYDDKDSSFTIRTEKEGKYGRIIGWIYMGTASDSINKLMVLNGYAQIYGDPKNEKSFNELKSIRISRGTWDDINYPL